MNTSSSARLAGTIFAVGAVGLAVAMVGEAVAVRSSLAVPGDMFSAALRRSIWWEWAQRLVPLVILPGIAAGSLRIRERAGPPSRAAARNVLIGASIWIVGAVSSQLPALTATDGGWFNYAPNDGVRSTPSFGGPPLIAT